MAQIVLGIGTSHTPLLALPPEMWAEYAKGDSNMTDLVYPPDARVLNFQDGAKYLPAEIRNKPRDLATFQKQSAACQKAVATLADTMASARADVTIIISDDQDEWFYDSNMPRFAVYWGDTIPLIPRGVPAGAPEFVKLTAAGYGDVQMDVPVASKFGRFILDYLLDHDFDVAHMTYAEQQYGGTVARRYPSPDGEVTAVRTNPTRTQGLPHGFAFVVKRIFNNQPGPIVPIFQNTCYPPNTPTPKRSYQLGRAIAGAVAAWPDDIRVAIVASGGLSHFVVDEEIDRMVLDALQRQDAEALQSLPRHRLLSATSESLNWVALGAAIEDTSLKMELLDYVPVYRTEAATGGGWAFARWQ